MSFETEPTGYEKTMLSELQASWENLRCAVVENFGFPDSDKLLFHIDEAMSWESVRNLKHMKFTFLIVQNIIAQTDSPKEVIEWADNPTVTVVCKSPSSTVKTSEPPVRAEVINYRGRNKKRIALLLLIYPRLISFEHHRGSRYKSQEWRISAAAHGCASARPVSTMMFKMPEEVGGTRMG